MDTISKFTLVLLAVWVSSCSSEGPTVLYTDMAGGSIFLADAHSGKVENQLDLSDWVSNECDDGTDECLMYQARAISNSEVAFTWCPFDNSMNSATAFDRPGRVQSVDLALSDSGWRLDSLDFSVHFSDGSQCAFDVDNPCVVMKGEDPNQAWKCRLYQPHDFEVVSQSDAEVELWVADTRNARLLKVTLPTESTCAVVNEVINHASSPDWDVYNAVNSIDYDVIDGVETMLMTIKDTFEGADGGEQLTGDGRGKVLFWERRDEEWAQVWEFPPQSRDEERFVNSPHGVAKMTTDDGRTLVLYAHSLGRGEGYDEGVGGSVGVLEIIDGVPVYLFDGVINEVEPNYTRDVRPLSDGTVIIVDSGCKSDQGCEVSTGSWVAKIPTRAPSSKGGWWTPSLSAQEFIELEVLHGPHFADFGRLYSAELVSW